MPRLRGCRCCASGPGRIMAGTVASRPAVAEGPETRCTYIYLHPRSMGSGVVRPPQPPSLPQSRGGPDGGYAVARELQVDYRSCCLLRQVWVSCAHCVHGYHGITINAQRIALTADILDLPDVRTHACRGATSNWIMNDMPPLPGGSAPGEHT